MGEFLKSVACSGTDCSSWILVLFNILAVFYLVFCSFWKVTRAAKITGWVWIAGLLCATVGVLIAHTCIYILLVIIFTAMMIMAILAVILPQQSTADSEERAEKRVKLGSYVISGTDDGRYVFAIHDAQRKLIVKSKYSYATVDEAKREICVCRDNGMMAAISDKTGAWIKEEYYPTFEIYARDGSYYFCLSINGDYVIFNSESYGDIKSCERMLEKAKTLVASTAVYINTVKVSGRDYLHFVKPESEEQGEGKSEETEARVAYTEEPLAVEDAREKEEDVSDDTVCDDVIDMATDVVCEDAPEDDPEDDPAQALEEASDGGAGGNVVFNAEVVKTLWDKYADLSTEQRGFFDAIRNHANAKNDIKCIEAKNYLTFKYTKDKLVRLRIRKDMVEAVFVLVSSTFKNAFSEGEIKVKEAATVIRVENEAHLDVALKTIDMAYETLLEDRKRRKEEQKAKRRAKAREAAQRAKLEAMADAAEPELEAMTESATEAETNHADSSENA